MLTIGVGNLAHPFITRIMEYDFDNETHITVLKADEQWKYVRINGVINTDYEVSNQANVRQKVSGRFLKQSIQSTNYKGKRKEKKIVSLMIDGKFRQQYVHRLVAEAFVPNPDGLGDVEFIKGKSCAASNLRWANRSESVGEGMKKRKKPATHPNTGVKRTRQSKLLMSIAKKGELHPSFEGHYIIEGKKFTSADDAAKHAKVSIVTVQRRCKKVDKEKKWRGWAFRPKDLGKTT